LNSIRARLKSSRHKVSPSATSPHQEYAVFLFESTQGAIKAERALLRAGMTVKLIPTPRQLSSDCGTALRCSWSEAERVIEVLREASVSFASMHHVSEQD